MLISWDEFKFLVDEKIAESGMDDSILVGLIDVTPYVDSELFIDASESGLEILSHIES